MQREGLLYSVERTNFVLYKEQMAAILIVEDNPDLAGAMARLLEQAGFATTTAGSLRDGRYLLGAHEYAAVVCDGALPDGDGLELLSWARMAGSRARGSWSAARSRTFKGERSWRESSRYSKSRFGDVSWWRQSYG
jgi:hypothetical protein